MLSFLGIIWMYSTQLICLNVVVVRNQGIMIYLKSPFSNWKMYVTKLLQQATFLREILPNRIYLILRHVKTAWIYTNFFRISKERDRSDLRPDPSQIKVLISSPIHFLFKQPCLCSTLQWEAPEIKVVFLMFCLFVYILSYSADIAIAYYIQEAVYTTALPRTFVV